MKSTAAAEALVSSFKIGSLTTFKLKRQAAAGADSEYARRDVFPIRRRPKTLMGSHDAKNGFFKVFDCQQKPSRSSPPILADIRRKMLLPLLTQCSRCCLGFQPNNLRSKSFSFIFFKAGSTIKEQIGWVKGKKKPPAATFFD